MAGLSDSLKWELKRNPLFEDLPENEFNSMIAAATPQVFKTRQRLFNQGDPGGSLIIILSGRIKVSVVARGLGGITESDVNLAVASSAIIIAFNVRADAAARRLISETGTDVRYYSIIYQALEEVKNAITGLMAPKVKEEVVGIAEVRDVFRSSKMGAVAGCLVMEGAVRRNCPIRVLRNNVVVFEGELESLRRFKDDVNEVRAGTECGIAVRNYNDVQPGDQIEVYQRIEVPA